MDRVSDVIMKLVTVYISLFLGNVQRLFVEIRYKSMSPLVVFLVLYQIESKVIFLARNILFLIIFIVFINKCLLSVFLNPLFTFI